jgi:hypothetical protein
VSAQSIGEIGLDLVVNKNDFNKQMAGIAGTAKKAAAALAAAFSVKKLVEFGKSCVELGSDLAEVQNVVDVTFSSMSDKVDEFAKSAINAYGLSETMAKQYTGTFGAMAKAFGFTEQQAYDMGTTLTGLAGDVASFYNITQDEAYTKLKSVFTGETESLKDLGVVMTQTALDAYAMANGFGKTTSAMSEAEKVALRYQFVQSQLSAAQGDFARTSDSWANQVRILKLQFDSLKAIIGQGLINVLSPVIKVINTIIGKLATLASAFKAFTDLITGNKNSSSNISSIGSAAADAGSGLESASSAADDLTDATTSAGKAAKKAAQEMRSLMGFDAINKLSDSSDDSSDSGSSGSGSGSGVGSSVDFGSLSSGETILDEVDSKFTKMFENIKKLCDPATQSLKRLWNEGLSRLGKFTWTALKDFYSGFLVPVGKWTLGTGIPRFVDALNNGLMKVNFQKINEGLKKLWDSLAPFAIHVGEGLLWFWESVLVPLGTWTANEVVPRFLTSVSNAIGILNPIIEALQPLAQWFLDSLLKPLASWTGGVFLKTWDCINSALQKFSDWCKDNPQTIQTITIIIASFFAAFKIVSLVTQIAGLIKSFAGIGAAVSKLGGLISSVWNPWILIIGSVIAAGVLLYKNWDTVCQYAGKMRDWVVGKTRDLKNNVVKFFQKMKDKAVKIWDDLGAYLKKKLNQIAEFFSVLWKSITETFKNIGKWFKDKFDLAYKNVTSAFANTKTFFSEKKKNVTDTFSNIGKWFKDKFDLAYKNVTAAFANTKTFFSGKKKNVTDTFSNIGQWFKDKFGLAYKNVTSAFANTGTFFSGIWKGIKNTFGNVTTWFRTTFANAWQAVKNVFSSGGAIFEGIKDGILSSLKSVINSLIRGINRVVSIPFSGLNSALNRLRTVSVAGLKPFTWLPTISTPQIPYLAQGGYVKPNTPQLAVIGDNRHQGEVTAPEDKLQEMATAAAKAAAETGNSERILELLLEIIELLKDMDPVVIDEESLRKYFIKKTNQNTKSNGKCELVT